MTELTDTTSKNKVEIIDDDKNTKLHYGCVLGNKERVLKELEKCLKVDIENYLGWTPLMMACRNGHLEIVKLLLDKKADATKKNKFGINVFTICVASENLELIRLMLQHLLNGGVSKLSLQKIFSPLSMAVLFSNVEISSYLIQQSFNINHQAPLTGLTPCMFSAATLNTEMFDLLIKCGANEHIQNTAGATAKYLIDLKRQKKYNKQKKTAKNNVYLEPPQHQVQQQYHQANIPMIMVSPLPPYETHNMHGPPANFRKSSDVHTPNYFMSPMTPITPVNFMPQMFFPPDFDAHQGMHYYGLYNEVLNQRMYPSSFLSPMTLNYAASPCI
ncbi:unnamed protein product [Brassicogethes aeneus]|uniref:Uncharacterized protein n=1 Tax=Brassicogethes aeneus TaxID=1431903 RepID=A0A9P0B4T4_BRAAE|nr:unnamed protein product [Brassicogethes aeneus]